MWSCLYGLVCNVLYGFVWSQMVLYGNVWFCMALRRYAQVLCLFCNKVLLYQQFLGPAFFFISPEWSILYGGVVAGTIAYFIGEFK